MAYNCLPTNLASIANKPCFLCSPAITIGWELFYCYRYSWEVIMAMHGINTQITEILNLTNQTAYMQNVNE